MGIAYRKFEPTEYVMKVKRGKVVQKGLGLSFFYNTMNTSMTVIPATAFDTGFAFDELMTADFQSVSVQGDISYMINDYEGEEGIRGGPDGSQAEDVQAGAESCKSMHH